MAGILDELGHEALLRELRARRRIRGTGELDIAQYERPLDELKDVHDSVVYARLREVQGKVYGVDSRQDLHEVNDAALVKDASSVVAFVEKKRLIDNGDGTWTLRGDPFGTSFNLCREERFRDQPCAGFCSGVLVRPDLVATAGHCVLRFGEPRFLEIVRVIVGYRMKSLTECNLKFDASQIYRVAELVSSALDEKSGADWGLVRLDRPVTTAESAPISRAGAIAAGTEVHIIGHPCGLPAKYAGGAQVTDAANATFFRANLDAYGGNSGSPVFNSKTHEVEGLLVRGAPDFVPVGNCYRSSVIPALAVGVVAERGEECARVALFADRLR